ncbi:MAG: UDP-glucose 4-epimerase GalE [Patescibacteria group bacterium]
MILVTGGAGYIGSHMNKYLNEKGINTVVLDDLSNGFEELVKWGAFEKANLLNKQQLDSVFDKYDFEAVIHFAAFADVADSVSNPGKYYRNNVLGTLNLLDSMREHNVNTLVYSSTSATYGMPEEMPILETQNQDPINPYGMSKLFTEKILTDYAKAYGLKFVAFRYFNAAGCAADSEIGEMHQPEHHLIPLVLDAALGIRDSIKIFGTDYATKDGTCLRDYVHVTDLAQAHLKAVEYLQSGGNSDFFNLGLGYGFTVKEIIEAAKEVTGVNFKVDEAPRRAGDPPELCSGGKKAREVLNWEPEYNSIKDIIQTAWDWHTKYRSKENAHK